jgi:hypothetical protein
MVAILKTENLARVFGGPPSPIMATDRIGFMGFGASAAACVRKAQPW